ncbi:MAG TPA: hypothetical protein VH482_06885 [Thermomicrobiales bacterium]|jgi:hypothetical protein
MSVPRLSVRYNDAVDAHGEALAGLVRATSARGCGATPSPDHDRVAALGRRTLASFEAVRQQALALDDALRAIGMIARAGCDTPKVRRTLKEIVADQDRLAAVRGTVPCADEEVR